MCWDQEVLLTAPILHMHLGIISSQLLNLMGNISAHLDVLDTRCIDSKLLEHGDNDKSSCYGAGFAGM